MPENITALFFKSEAGGIVNFFAIPNFSPHSQLPRAESHINLAIKKHKRN